MRTCSGDRNSPGDRSLTGHAHPHMPRVERAQVGHSDIAEGENSVPPLESPSTLWMCIPTPL